MKTRTQMAQTRSHEHHHAKTCVLELLGEVTVLALDELKVRVLAEISANDVIVLDCHQLAYLDSAALQFLWALQLECVERKISLQLLHLNDGIRRTAAKLGLEVALKSA